jgi:hypothetical protein
MTQDVAQFGRVPGLEPGCRRFKSCRPDQLLFGLLALFLVGCSPPPPVAEPEPERLSWTQPVQAADGYAYALTAGGTVAIVVDRDGYREIDLIEPHAPPERAWRGVVYPSWNQLTYLVDGELYRYRVPGLVLDVLDYHDYAMVATQGSLWLLDERGLTRLGQNL